MRHVSRRVLVLPASALAFAAASWGPVCALSAWASCGGPTIAPTGFPATLLDPQKRPLPLLPAALARGHNAAWTANCG
jgi:hypothetical protein